MQYFLLTQLSRITSVTCDLRALLQNQLTGFLNTGNYMFHIIQKKFNYYQPIQMMIKMADSEVSSELYSNLFHQNGLISSVNECVCSIDVNSKLKCALDEISSLNQIMQLLLNDLNSVRWQVRILTCLPYARLQAWKKVIMCLLVMTGLK